MSEMQMLKRCAWAMTSQQYIDYHDKEWGVPVHDDRKLFEMLILEGVQAGLSWSLILKKRAGYLQAVDNFYAGKIAPYDGRKVQELLAEPEIIRNRLEIQGALQKVGALLKIEGDLGCFDALIGKFVEEHPQKHAWKSMQELPASTRESDAMSKALKQRGFTFVGTTICYAFMQAVGMVNDHIVECFRWQEVQPLVQ